MAVPKRKMSKARTRSRRTRKDRLKAPNLVLCPNPECGAPMLTHRACPECGTIRRRSGDLLQAVTIEEEAEEAAEEAKK
jgi:large subunit ribosomal protein L32